MLTYRRARTTSAPPDEVWSYLADFTTTNQWDPRAHRTRRTSGDGGVGTRYATDVAFLGRVVPMTYEITDLQPHHTIEWVGHSRWVRAHDRIATSPYKGGTILDYVTQYEYLVAPRLLDRLMAAPVARLCDDACEGLDRTLRQVA